MTSLLDSYRSLLGFGDFADIYLEQSDALTLRWQEGRVEEISASESSGAGLRLMNGFETRFGHIDLARPLDSPLSQDQWNRLHSILSQINTGVKKTSVEPIRLREKKTHKILKDPRHFLIEDKIDIFKRAYKAAQKGPAIRQINMNYGEKIKRVGYLNSDGEAYFEHRVYMVLSITVMAEKNGDRQNAYEALGGISGFEIFDGDVVEKLAARIADRALKKLVAPQAPAGEMPVVIASSAGGTLIHEAVGHALEADAIVEGTSPAFAGKVGKRVAHPKLTIYDDPTVPSKRGSFFYDDEGTPSESSCLIENGVLKDYMFDRLSAKRVKRQSNGHGRRESYAHRPIPRMSNTFIAPGKEDPKTIIESLENGLLVTKMGGGQVNTTNGDFVFDVEEGFLVKNGKKEMVRGATLLGNGPEVLLNTDQVGWDHGWGIVTCGKEGQGVPVSDAIPTIRIKKLVVGGRN